MVEKAITIQLKSGALTPDDEQTLLDKASQAGYDCSSVSYEVYARMKSTLAKEQQPAGAKQSVRVILKDQKLTSAREKALVDLAAKNGIDTQSATISVWAKLIVGTAQATEAASAQVEAKPAPVVKKKPASVDDDDQTVAVPAKKPVANKKPTFVDDDDDQTVAVPAKKPVAKSRPKQNFAEEDDTPASPKSPKAKAAARKQVKATPKSKSKRSAPEIDEIGMNSPVTFKRKKIPTDIVYFLITFFIGSLCVLGYYVLKPIFIEKFADDNAQEQVASEQNVDQETYYTFAEKTWLRSEPSTTNDNTRIRTLEYGTAVQILDDYKGWTKVFIPATNEQGYVSSDFLLYYGRFIRLNSIMNNLETRLKVYDSKYRIALLEYAEDRGYIGSADYDADLTKLFDVANSPRMICKEVLQTGKINEFAVRAYDITNGETLDLTFADLGNGHYECTSEPSLY